jgi:hypothetical protein
VLAAALDPAIPLVENPATARHSASIAPLKGRQRQSASHVADRGCVGADAAEALAGGRTLEWENRIAVIGAVTTAWDRAHAAVASMGNRFPLIRMDSTEHRLASGRRAFANTGGETLMSEELVKLVANVIDGVDPDTPADIDGSERILVAANVVTLARTTVEFDYRGDVVDAHAPEAPTRFAKQLTQVMRGAIAIGLSHESGLRLAIRVARDSLPPMRLAIIDDLAKHPCSTPTDVRRRLGKPPESPLSPRNINQRHMHTDGYLDSDKAGTNGAPRPRTGRNICEVCERALARTDTGMCDFCTVKQQRQAGGVA